MRDGYRVDLNERWLSEHLYDRGIETLSQQILSLNGQSQRLKLFKLLDYVPPRFKSKAARVLKVLAKVRLRPQKRFNFEVKQTFAELLNLLRHVRQEQHNIRQEVRDLERFFRRELQLHRSALSQMEGHQADLVESQAAAARQIALIEKLQRVGEITFRNEIAAIRANGSGIEKASAPAYDPSASAHLDSFFLEFDELFRGSRDLIRDRLKPYLTHVQNLGQEILEAPVLDLGCGRGEWLELLKNSGISCRGVETNQVLVRLCESYGLNVTFTDAISALRAADDNSLSAVTAFHVIEHLPFPVLMELVREIKRVLKPGGLFIFETPNPKNLHVATNNFWFDPTHIHPIPSQFIQAVAQMTGFEKTQVIELNPFPETMRLQGGVIADRLNELLYCGQDYALIGYCP